MLLEHLKPWILDPLTYDRYLLKLDLGSAHVRSLLVKIRSAHVRDLRYKFNLIDFQLSEFMLLRFVQ